MVDEEALKTLLKSTGLPVSYSHFKKPPDPPYLVYLFDNSENFGADDKVYHRESNYRVELYTEKHDPAAQAQIETLFDSNDIFWEKDEVWIESEKLFQTAYYI